MSENRNKGLFYGLLVVGIVVVSIVGASFAYFAAFASNNAITGNTAPTGLELKVEKVSTSATGGLIPMNDSDLSKAITATTMCKDKNNNTACQVYKATVTNIGTSTVVMNGTLTITAKNGSTFTNLKWQQLTYSGSTYATSGTANPIATKTFVSNVSLGGSATQTYYFAVWISNVNSDQTLTDKGEFIGTLTFNSADGKGVAADFS